MFKSNWFKLCCIFSASNLALLFVTDHFHSYVFYITGVIFLGVGIICDSIVEAVNYLKEK